jgi:hypothetical protein
MISPSQRPLPDNTQHSQQTNIHAPSWIRTHDLSRRAAVDLRLRPRGYWDRHIRQYEYKFKNVNRPNYRNFDGNFSIFKINKKNTHVNSKTKAKWKLLFATQVGQLVNPSQIMQLVLKPCCDIDSERMRLNLILKQQAYNPTHWIQLVLDTDQLQALINTVWNLRDINGLAILNHLKTKKSLLYAQIFNSHRTQNTVPPVERPFIKCCMEK